MTSAAEILVIILAIVLAVFLVVAIILGIYLIKLSAEIRRIAHVAQSTVSTVGKAAQDIAKFTSPVIILKTVAGFAKKLTKKEK